MEEQWAPLWGHDNDYMVSDRGRVRSHKRKTLITHGEPLVMRPQKTTGYRFVKLSGVCYLLHHIVYFSFNEGDPPKKKDGLEINHIDGDKTNNALSNLELVTTGENARHRAYTLKSGSWGNIAQQTTATVLATGEVVTFPSRRALLRSFKKSEVHIHG